MSNNQFYEHALSFDLSEVGRCVLCHDPACSKACPKNVPVGDILRSLYLENYLGAAEKLGTADCMHCEAPCEDACVLSHVGIPVSISRVLTGLDETREKLPQKRIEEVDLSTDICGVKPMKTN